MENLLLPASIVGCSVSVLFALSTFVVLGCYKEKTRPLMIKQQLALSLVLTYVVALSGFQGFQNEIACRVVTILLHYGVTSSFCWIFTDIYHTTTCVKRGTFTSSFPKLLLCVWGIPFIFTVAGVIVGTFVKYEFRTRSKFYICWKSDQVVWTLVIPCFILITLSCYFLFKCTHSMFQKRNSSSSQKERRSIAAIKYSIKTNMVMLLLTTVIWIFGCEIFWFNTDVKYQLVFGLTVGVQGLFLFFFYCVFCLEHDLYISDNILDDFSGHFYDDMEAPSAKKAAINISKTLVAKKCSSGLPEVKFPQTVETNPKISCIEENSLRESVSETILHFVTEASMSDRVDLRSPSTKAMIHSPEVKSKCDLQLEKNETQQREDISIETEKTVEKKDSSNEKTDVEMAIVDERIGPDQLADKGLSIDKVLETQLETKNKEKIDQPKEKSENEMQVSHSLKTTQEISQKNSYTGSEFSLGGGITTNASRSRKDSTTSPLPQGISSYIRPTRPSSRSSQASFASTMGLNELESLFNNPDLMKQSITKRNREKNNAEEQVTNKREIYRQSRKTVSQATTNDSELAKDSKKKRILNSDIAEDIEKNSIDVVEDKKEEQIEKEEQKVEDKIEINKSYINEIEDEDLSNDISEKAKQIVNKYLKEKDNG